MSHTQNKAHDIGNCPICNKPAERYDSKSEVPKEMIECEYSNEYYICYYDKDFPNRKGVIRVDAK